MAATSLASAGCKAAASLAAPAKLDLAVRHSTSQVAPAFGLRPAAARVSCSLEDSVKSFVDAGKTAAIVLASSALLANVRLYPPPPLHLIWVFFTPGFGWVGCKN